MVASVVLIPMTALLLGASFSKHTFSSSSSQISIKGSSNLHDWESQVTLFEGELDFSSSAEGQVSVTTGQLRIDVSSIKSNRGSSIMDKKTFKAPKILRLGEASRKKAQEEKKRKDKPAKPGQEVH